MIFRDETGEMISVWEETGCVKLGRDRTLEKRPSCSGTKITISHQSWDGPRRPVDISGSQALTKMNGHAIIDDR